MSSEKKGIILYELNEVPRALIEKYIQLRPKSTIAEILNHSKLFDTFTYDTGELHPWTTWPTIHRGVNNNLHNIQFINQELKINNKYPPIWDILQKNKISVGVYGSLQSYPPLKSKFIKFFLPDTFSPDSDAFPEELEEFQRFNLAICKDNKAVSSPIKATLYLDFLNLLAKNLISLKSCFKTIKHITSEIYSSKYKSRRSLLQPVLNFDLYVNHLVKYQPKFTTYFTNHVAGMMHRYWIYLFNEKGNKDIFNKNSLIKSMDIADSQLKRLVQVSKNNNYNIIITSSMGQKLRENISPDLDICLISLSKLCKSIGINPMNYRELPAMQPDICIKCSTKKALESLRNNIKRIRDTKDNNILTERYEPIDLNLNISIKMTSNLYKDQKIKVDGLEKELKDTGFKIVNRDPGTAYHCPEGMLFTYGDDFFNNIFKNLNNPVIDTTKIAPTILNYFEIKLPPYMKS